MVEIQWRISVAAPKLIGSVVFHHSVTGESVNRSFVAMWLSLAMCVSATFAQETASPNSNLSPKVQAWTILDNGVANSSYEKRSKAVQVLGLLRDNSEAESMAVKALSDERPEVRASAAAALGNMGAKRAIPDLRKMFQDSDVSVILASARALLDLGDKTGYNVYYAILTGQTKTGQGLLDQQKKMLKDPQKMAQFGFETGIGFIPFAGVGWTAFKTLHKDDVSPVLAASALTLANDPDPKSGQALVDAAEGNKSWIVRAAALNALAKRGDPKLIKAPEDGLTDEKEEVQYSAAAAVIRLSDIAEHERTAPAKRPPAKRSPKK
jgi:HEAT repeats